MPTPRNQALDALPIDFLLEQYSDPMISMADMAKMYGCGVPCIHGRLTVDRQRFDSAQAIRARRLHELAIQALQKEPDVIYDKDGNARFDPAAVTWRKNQADGFARIAGILDRNLSERQQVDVTHNASTPLADYIARIASGGSTLPVAPARLVETVEGSAREIVDTVEVEQLGDVAPLE